MDFIEKILVIKLLMNENNIWEFKGKKILEPKDKKQDHLKDLVKESIFNIIKHSNKFNIKFKNSNVLDLFSGVGSFGLECLSRGAKKVIF